jgi:hypothetical protein
MDMNNNKEPFEVFYDVLFKCRAPWQEINSVLLALQQMLPSSDPPSPYPNGLKAYAQSPRTSTDHVKYAEYAFATFDAAIILIMLLEIHHKGWSTVLNGLFTSARASSRSLTRFSESGNDWTCADSGIRLTYSMGGQEIESRQGSNTVVFVAVAMCCPPT